MPSAVAAIAANSAASLCRANGSAGVLALEPIGRGLQARLAVARATEQPPGSTPASLMLETKSTSLATVRASAARELWNSSN